MGGVCDDEDDDDGYDDGGNDEDDDGGRESADTRRREGRGGMGGTGIQLFFFSVDTSLLRYHYQISIFFPPIQHHSHFTCTVDVANTGLCRNHTRGCSSFFVIRVFVPLPY